MFFSTKCSASWFNFNLKVYISLQLYSKNQHRHHFGLFIYWKKNWSYRSNSKKPAITLKIQLFGGQWCASPKKNANGHLVWLAKKQFTRRSIVNSLTRAPGFLVVAFTANCKVTSFQTIMAAAAQEMKKTRSATFLNHSFSVFLYSRCVEFLFLVANLKLTEN